MLGYAEGQKAYRLWVPEKWKIILAESIYFDEDSSFHDRMDDSLPLVDLDKEPIVPRQETSQVDSTLESLPTENIHSEVEVPSSHPDVPPILPPSTSQSTSQTNLPVIQTRPQRIRREPAWFRLNTSEENYHRAAELPPSQDSTYYINMAEHLLKEEHTQFAYSAVTLSTETEPKSYKEAMHSPQTEEWQEAINDEKNSLIALGVFETIRRSDIPKD